MFATFYGAAREVTGSMHLLQTDSNRILLDCGIFQGRRKECEQKNKTLPFDPKIITNMVLSHAHMDHSGRIPLLTKNHFAGRVICTRATQDASEYLLRDSAHIQESDADYLNYKTVRAALHRSGQPSGARKVSKRRQKDVQALLKQNKHDLNRDTIQDLLTQYHLERVEPLYTKADVENALQFFDGYPYAKSIPIGQDASCTFYEAGHILGSAISVIKARENGRNYTIGFTGDLGRFSKPIIKDPALEFAAQDRELDLLILESTYGNRIHESAEDTKARLKTILIDTVERGGTLLIPAFAFGRAQEIIYELHELYNNDEVPTVPIYVDSPLASNITKVFGEHPELYDREAHAAFLEKGLNPFMFNKIEYVKSVEESMSLMREELPHIVIASSGMCEAGRILHHLRYKIHNPKNTILMVGFMAQHTLGRRILEEGTAYKKAGRPEPAPMMTFFNKTYPLKAHVEYINGFSAHADKNEMVRFLKTSNLKIKRIAIVHGEEDQALAFASHLTSQGYQVSVPRSGEILKIH
ncbi:MAG: MBL fold metallo-hydrolase [Pseudomonadota bacterium]